MPLPSTKTVSFYDRLLTYCMSLYQFLEISKSENPVYYPFFPFRRRICSPYKKALFLLHFASSSARIPSLQRNMANSNSTGSSGPVSQPPSSEAVEVARYDIVWRNYPVDSEHSHAGTMTVEGFLRETITFTHSLPIQPPPTPAANGPSPALDHTYYGCLVSSRFMVHFSKL
jgi:hypothetical protein